jgi:hypothetical protein
MTHYSHPVSEDDRAIAREIGELLAPKCAENEKGLQDAHPVTQQIQ